MTTRGTPKKVCCAGNNSLIAAGSSIDNGEFAEVALILGGACCAMWARALVCGRWSGITFPLPKHPSHREECE